MLNCFNNVCGMNDFSIWNLKCRWMKQKCLCFNFLYIRY